MRKNILSEICRMKIISTVVWWIFVLFFVFLSLIEFSLQEFLRDTQPEIGENIFQWPTTSCKILVQHKW